MKKFLVLSLISLIAPLALADNSKNGVYISAKMGASILQMKGQFFPYIVFPNNINEKQKGDNHRTAVFGTGLSLGYDFYDNFNLPVRAELDFTSRANADYNYSKSQENSIFFLRNTIKNQIEANTLMFNAYYDFKNPSDFTPYLSAGLGYAYLSQKTSQIATLGISGGKTSTETLQTRSHATNNFAWSAGAGIKYTVSQDFSFDLSYKYLDAGQAEVDYFNLDGVETNVKTKVRTHDIMLSATYHF